MAIDVLVVEIGVKLLADFDVALAVLFENNGKVVVVDFRILELLGALLGKTLGADNFSIGPLLGPFGDEDVVLKVESDNVAYVAAELVDFGPGFFCEGDGREDGEVAGCELDYGAGSVR